MSNTCQSLGSTCLTSRRTASGAIRLRWDKIIVYWKVRSINSFNKNNNKNYCHDMKTIQSTYIEYSSEVWQKGWDNECCIHSQILWVQRKSEYSTRLNEVTIWFCATLIINTQTLSNQVPEISCLSVLLKTWNEHGKLRLASRTFHDCS